MSETKVLVNNWRVTWFGRFWLAKVLCWHGTRSLRLLEAANGGEIYCDRCGMKRVGWIYDPGETIPPASTGEHQVPRSRVLIVETAPEEEWGVGPLGGQR